jgi:hypothetical protein
MKTKQTKKHLVRVAITLLVALLCHVTGAWAQETFIFAGFSVSYNWGTGECRSLIDGKYTSGNHSKWCVESNQRLRPTSGSAQECYWLEFNSASPINVESYILTTANDNTEYPGRNPKSWRLEGKLNASDNWNVLSWVENDATMQDVNFTDYEFPITNRGSYQYFRFLVFETQGSNYLQLEELRLRGSANPTYMACATVSGLQRRYQYTGSSIPLDYLVCDYNGNQLTQGTDFYVEIIRDNNYKSEVKEKGTYTLAFRGRGSYSGVLNATFEVGDGSQTEFQIGGGTDQSAYLPIDAYYNYCLTQQLYTGDEIHATGTINSIAFKNVGTEKTRSIDIYLVLTDKSSFSGSNDWISVSESDKVFSGEVNFISGDWTTITLDTPFAYDDSYNLAVIVDDNTGSYTSSTNFLAYRTSKNQALYARNDGTDYDPENPPRNGINAPSKNQLLLGMEIGDVGICPLPTPPTMGSITIHSAMVTWAGRGDTWNLQYKAAAATDWTTVTGLIARSYPLSGLFPGIDYQVRVQTVCGADNTSPWVTTSFTTPTIFQGAGTISNPWLITTKDDWDNLAAEVAAGHTYEGEYLEMNAHIGTAAEPVTRMVGGQGKPFSGHFSGGGFTLTVNIVGTQSEVGAAPFSNIDGATIEGLTVMGHVKGNAFHAGGLVGCCDSNAANVIENCTIETNVEAKDYGGGIVGHGGHGNLTLQKCVYSGTITNNTNTTFSGGLLGWCDQLTFTIKNCLFKGAFVGSARYHPIALSNNGSKTNPTVSKALYLNTITATATGTNKVIAGAEGTPVSTTATGEYTVPIKAADGIIYYMEATGGVATDVEVGDGGTASDTYLPTYSYYKYSLTQQIYTPDEIGMAGTISAIAFKNTVVERTRNISIYMVETDKETFANKTDWEAISAEDLVFSGQVTFTVGEWTKIDLDAPFAYDANSNLLVCVADNSGTYDDGSQHLSCLVFNASSQAIRSYRDGAAYNVANPGVDGTIMNVKNQLQLSITPIGGSFCAKPKLAVGDITGTGATLTVSGGSETYNVQYRLASATNWTEVAANSTDGTCTLTDLQPLTAYVVRAQSVCSTDASSEWREASFTTTAIAQEVGNSWSDDFEGSACSWELFNGSLENAWTWGTAVSNGGTHALYLSNDGGSTHAYSINSKTKVFAAKLFHFDEGKYQFSYDWLANGESNYDFLRVALVPASQTLTAGTDYTSIDKTNLPTGWIALDGGGQLNQASTWQSKSVTVSVRGTYYLVFAWRNDGIDGNQPPAAIDNVSILKQIAGDVDNDGDVTISDAIAVVNYILGNVPDNFNVENADVDGSTSITITDAVAIVDIVLHPDGN